MYFNLQHIFYVVLLSKLLIVFKRTTLSSVVCHELHCVCVRAYPLGPNQLLLRGSYLKNTRWIFGTLLLLLLFLF